MAIEYHLYLAETVHADWVLHVLLEGGEFKELQSEPVRMLTTIGITILQVSPPTGNRGDLIAAYYEFKPTLEVYCRLDKRERAKGHLAVLQAANTLLDVFTEDTVLIHNGEFSWLQRSHGRLVLNGRREWTAHSPRQMTLPYTLGPIKDLI